MIGRAGSVRVAADSRNDLAAPELADVKVFTDALRPHQDAGSSLSPATHHQHL
jgi:hypothetical protein